MKEVKSRTQEKRERNEAKREQRSKLKQTIVLPDGSLKVIYHEDTTRRDSLTRKDLWDRINRAPKPRSKSFAKKYGVSEAPVVNAPEAKVITQGGRNTGKTIIANAVGKVKRLFNRKAS
jgi:hypothetical protein